MLLLLNHHQPGKLKNFQVTATCEHSESIQKEICFGILDFLMQGAGGSRFSGKHKGKPK